MNAVLAQSSSVSYLERYWRAVYRLNAAMGTDPVWRLLRMQPEGDGKGMSRAGDTPLADDLIVGVVKVVDR